MRRLAARATLGVLAVALLAAMWLIPVDSDPGEAGIPFMPDNLVGLVGLLVGFVAVGLALVAAVVVLLDAAGWLKS